MKILQFFELNLIIHSIPDFFPPGKIVHVYEELEKQRVACAICPDSETLLVGGGHSYISVYTHTLARNKDTTLSLQRKLLGHTDVVSCMSSSHNHRVFVSGSRDRSVIMWDLNKLSFVRFTFDIFCFVVCFRSRVKFY